MASGSQTKSGICADLPVAPTKRNSVASVTTGMPQIIDVFDRRRPLHHFAKGEGAVPLGIERPEKQKHAEDKTEVADAVDDKSFVAGARVVVIGVPKADQRVRTQAHAFPTDEQQQQTIAQTPASASPR